MISRRLFLVGSIAALLGAGALGGAAAADGKRYYFVQNVQGLSEPPPEALFEFDSHTFTNCGQTGRFGPSLSQCLSSYGSEWTDNPEHYTVNDGIQQWVVPVSGTYRIEAWGARAGRNSSRANGAYIAGDFDLERGQVLHILVGQRGTRSTTRSGNRHDGGGGGSFVATGDSYQVADPLLVAGGGGGSAHSTNNRMRGQTGQCGATASHGASGGCDGEAGETSNNSARPGAGFYGSDSHDDGPRSFRDGGVGATGNTSYSGDPGRGGFGGGGGTRASWYNRGGGGGGYSGGGASSNNRDGYAWGGGGGSFNAGENQSATAGANSGHGRVTITLLD